MQNTTHALFVVKNDRIHRTTCKRVNLESDLVSAELTARQMIESEDYADATPATCCKPAQSLEWKATVETLRAENEVLAHRSARPLDDAETAAVEDELVQQMEARLAREEAAEEGMTLQQLSNAIADAELRSNPAPMTDEEAAAKLGADALAPAPKAAKAPRAPRTAPEAGEPEDMGRKTVRASAHRVTYLSRTPRKSGSGYVAGSWETADGVRIDWTWEHNWTASVDGGSWGLEVRNLTAAVEAVAAARAAAAKLS